MKLYHGTSEAVARLALKEGLMPRGMSGNEGQWGSTVESNPDLVYLTTAYAPYFAQHAAETGERWAVIEVDTDKLKEMYFLPDEDFMEQATRDANSTQMCAETVGCETLPELDNMKDRTEWFRENLDFFAHCWRASITGLGNCAYDGKIPPEAITKVVLFDPKSNSMLTMGIDPCITLMNYRICGGKYRAATSWFVGEDPSPRAYLGFDNYPMSDDEFWNWFQAPRVEIEEMLAKRDGLEFLKGEPT